MLKAGENAIATSNLLAELIPKYLDSVSLISNTSKLAYSYLTGLFHCYHWRSRGVPDCPQGTL